MNNLFFFILSGIITQPIDSIPIIEKIIDCKADKIFADHFDNLYIISDNNFSKYDYKGEKLYSYFPQGGGEITDIDVQNPYKIIVYFEKQNKLIQLDNKLSPISNEILFETFDIFGKTLFTRATDGAYWLYDKDKSKLIKLNSQFNIEYKTNLIFLKEQISFKVNKSHLCFKSIDGEISFYNYLSNDFEPLFSLTIQGSFFIKDNLLSYYYNHSILQINIPTRSKRCITLPTEIEIIDAVIGNRKIFFFDKSNVYISSLKELVKK